MHNLPCINCVWVNLLPEFILLLTVMNSWDEGFSQTKCSAWLYDVLILWRGGESMWICASRAPDRHHSLFTKDKQQQTFVQVSEGDEGWCVVDLWPSPFYLALCASVSVCLCHDCGERCDLAAEWCARLVWRLRTNKHSALFLLHTSVSCSFLCCRSIWWRDI